jgi:6,7-dimethyl-8-ribityllumazine synthase
MIVSRYNSSITAKLLEGAQEEYAARGGDIEDLALYEAAGAYELPALALAAAETGRYRGILALGCLIRGETRHDRYIAQATANGLMQVTLQIGIPVCFGVLTVDTPKQAKARAGGEKGNKGQESMAALLDTVSMMEQIRDGVKRPAVVLAGPDKAKSVAAEEGMES